MDYQTTYTYRGTIVGNEASVNSTDLFSVTVRLATFDLYAPRWTDSGVIMEERETDYDDRTGNNDGQLMGSFSVFHDIRLTSITGGPNEATEGNLNAGMTTLRANVVYGGSSATNQYDWRVAFTVVDENGQSALPGGVESMMSNECLAANHAQQTIDYTHKPLSQVAEGTAPEGTACLDIVLNAGRFTVTATAHIVNATEGGDTAPEDAVDMNSGNDIRATTFEVINDIPTVYMTLDEISRDGESVDAPVIVGDSITMRARGQDTEDDAANMPLMTEWTRIDNSGEMMMLDTCMGEICSVETDASWIGTARITATVTDSNGAATSDVLEISVWNHYTNDMTVTDATLSYSLVFSGLTPLDVSATNGTAQDLQQLGENMGAYNSTVSFEMTTSHIFGHQDIGTESLTIAFDGNPAAPWGLWYKRTTDSAWENVAGAVASAGDNGGVVMTYTHDGGLMGSLNGGTYAIFDVASEEAAPPATGIDTITATPMPSSQVMIDWTYEDDSLLGNSDLVALYWCTGVDCTVDMSEPVFTTTPTQNDWKLVGDHGETYTVLVQTENGNGPDKTGGAKSVTITADGEVSPAPTIDANDPTVEDTGLTFTWTATNTDDVESWVICWAGSQAVVQDSFDSVIGEVDPACAETSDTTTSLTVTEQDMCSGECNTNMFFAIGAMDATGNVYSPSEGTDHLMTVDYTSGIADPGVIDGGSDPAGGDEGMPSTAIAAIIVLVVVAVIGGAFILTRGAEGDGEDKEWDY
ncbi:MAG: hypothetical protein CMB52_02935 [Euryarchaeota archaeon]|nr:hypothetical protein [Euryarchaeota archaeon]